MSEYAVALGEATDTAVEAGALIREKIGSEFWHGYKSCPADLVTEVDRQAEELITSRLKKSFPGWFLIAEEASSKACLGAENSPTWYIDPLDGTTNFVFGIPFCCVSIGLAVDGEVHLAVVHDPLRKETFTALKGQGAYLNGQPVLVDQTRERLAMSLIVTGFPGDKKFNQGVHAVNLPRVIDECSNLRALGSAALELSYVACGRLTGFFEATLRPWDVAAGKLLVEEAGGKVTDLAGKPLTLTPYLSILATNDLIHQELLDCLKK